MSKLPKESVAVRMAPELAEAIEAELAPYSGKALEHAQAAVMRVRRSGFAGQFSDLVAHYRGEIRAAVA